jgi:uncharacterized protein (TIGR02594 family)
MVQLHAFRRLLRVVSLCVVALASISTAMVASSNCASAKSYRHSHRHVHARYVHAHFVHRHFAGRYLVYRHYRHVARRSRWDAGVARMRAGGFANANASIVPYVSMAASPDAQASQSKFASQSSFASRSKFSSQASFTPQSSFGSSDVIATARRYLGGNPTGRGSLWCARFMNMVLQQTGHHGTGSDLASSFAHYGERISGPQVGAIAVMGRRGGGHVGIITGIDASGNPIMISGNNGNRVREAPISRGRIYAYVLPTG